MVKIAFCDDDPAILQQMGSLLERYCTKRGTEITPVTFTSSLELLTEMEKGSKFDILFLDILMPGEDGMRTAEEIRSFDRNVKIIFLTSSSEYAVESYAVEAFYYQLKPVSQEDFFRLMDSVLLKCQKERTESLLFNCKNGITRVEPRSLEYCEVIHRTLYIHLTNGTVLECIGTIEQLQQQMSAFGCFLRPHRSYLINLQYVKHLSFRSVVMPSAEIPIPRGKYQEVKDAYLRFAFENGQVMV